MVNENYYLGEDAKNTEQKLLCMMVLDVSSSMQANGKIGELNAGLAQLVEDVKGDEQLQHSLEIGIVTFSSTVRCVQEPTLISPRYRTPVLTTDGSTRLIDGVRDALSRVEARKRWYHEEGIPYVRPYVILITDGYPNNRERIPLLAKEIRNGVENNKYVFWPIGVDQADMNMLREISHKAEPLKMKDHSFRGFFRWLKNSMEMIANSTEGEVVMFENPVAPNGWAQATI